MSLRTIWVTEEAYRTLKAYLDSNGIDERMVNLDHEQYAEYCREIEKVIASGVLGNELFRQGAAKVMDTAMQEWIDSKCHYLKGCLNSIKKYPNLFETYLPSMMESIEQMRDLIGYSDREMDDSSRRIRKVSE